MSCDTIKNDILDKKGILKLYQERLGSAGANKASISRQIKTINDEIEILEEEYSICLNGNNLEDIVPSIADIGIEVIEANCNNYDLIRFRENEPNKYYRSETDDDFSRGDILRLACDESTEGDVLQLNVGTFDINASKPLEDEGKGDLVFPMNVKLKGMGMGFTKLYTKKDGDGRCLKRKPEIEGSDVIPDCISHYDVGIPFQLTNTILEDLTLECKPDTVTKDNEHISDEEDTKTVGYDIHNDGIKYTSTLSRCKIISNAWGFYSWTNYGDKCDLFDCVIESGRQGVSLMGWGGGSDRNEINIYRSTFIIDGKNDYPKGDVSRVTRDCVTDVEPKLSYPAGGGVYGVICRAGHMKVVDCDFYITANKSLPRCIGISDNFLNGSRPSSNVIIQSFNNRFYITALGVRDAYAHFRLKPTTTLYSQNDYVEGVIMNNILDFDRDNKHNNIPRLCE